MVRTIKGHTNQSMVRTTSDKQTPRTFQGFFKDKDILILQTRHSLTPFDHSIA